MAFSMEHKLLIHITKKFALSLETGNNSCIDVLSTLIDSRRRGIHLIHANKQTTQKILDFLKENNKRHYNLFQTIANNFRQKKNIIKSLRKVVFLTGDTSTSVKEKGKIIYIPSSIANNSNIFYPTLFLGENINDCNFYAKKISKNFNKSIPISLQNIKLQDRYEGGGGNCTHVPYGTYKSRRIDLCICITDSDRTHPKDGIGETAKQVLKEDKKHKNPLCKALVIDFYSAENLIPINIIEKIYSKNKNKDQIDIFKKYKELKSLSSWKFIPLKKGINCQEIKSDQEKIKFLRSQLNINNIKHTCCLNTNCNNPILPKIGDKALQDSIKIDDEIWSSEINNETNEELLINYENITLEIISWLCTGEEIRC